MEFLKLIKELRINEGYFEGAYQIAPYGAINWYFCNIGLSCVIDNLSQDELEFYILPYLNKYISCLNDNKTIEDIEFKNGNPLENYKGISPDSHDSYASTFLSLVCKYLNKSHDSQFWEDQKENLKSIAYCNLALSAKPSGLITVFQPTANMPNDSGYLMDNCECYRGLKDFSTLLLQKNQIEDALYYGSFADEIVIGIKNILFDSSRNAFKVSDHSLLPEKTFYPGTTCQIFPEFFEIIFFKDRFDIAWNYLNEHTPGWEYGTYDHYPWGILGCVAFKRGDVMRAYHNLNTIKKRYQIDSGYAPIHELGYGFKLNKLLNSVITF